MIDEGGFDSQAPRRIAAIAIIGRRLHCSFVHGQQIKLSIVTFIEKQLIADFFNDNVPRIIGPGATHNCRQNRVSRENVAFSFAQFSDDRVIGGGDRVENTVHALQWFLVFHVYTVVSLIVVLHRPASKNIYPFLKKGLFRKCNK